MEDISGAAMSVLPVDTSLGTLSMIEIFIEYDGPRVFSCKSLLDQTFLAVWAEEMPDKDVWLYVPVSNARYQMVRSGGIALRDAFLHSEGFVYQVVTHFMPEVEDHAAPISRSLLQDAWLPAPEFKLDLLTATSPKALTPEQVHALALQEARGRLNIRVHLDKHKRTEAPTRKIGELLISTQSVLENLGNAQMSATPVQTGKIPNYITDKLASSVVGLKAASFVLELAPDEGEDLLGESPFTQAIGELVTLLDSSIAYGDLIARLDALQPRAAKSFRRFVEELASTSGDISVTAGGKSLGPRQASLSSEELKSLVTQLHEIAPDEPEEIRGSMILRMGDLDRARFGFHDPGLGKDYIGDISPQALAQFSSFELDAHYAVIISNKGEFDPAINVRRDRYLLEQLTKITD